MINVARVGASKGRNGVTSDSLSHKWLFLLKAARRTVEHTTQRGIRKILHPYLSRQLKTNNQALKYNRLKHNVFTEMIQAGTVSRRMNCYSRVYSTEFGW